MVWRGGARTMAGASEWLGVAAGGETMAAKAATAKAVAASATAATAS